MFRRSFLKVLSLGSLAAQASRPAAAAPAPPPPLPNVPLLETFVAGYQFHAGDTVERSLRAGDSLTLEREPSNPHDPNAIRILWNGTMIGYVPRRRNEVLARLLDHGRTLETRIDALHPEARPWKRVRVALALVGDGTAV